MFLLVKQLGNINLYACTIVDLGKVSLSKPKAKKEKIKKNCDACCDGNTSALTLVNEKEFAKECANLAKKKRGIQQNHSKAESYYNYSVKH